MLWKEKWNKIFMVRLIRFIFHCGGQTSTTYVSLPIPNSFTRVFRSCVMIILLLEFIRVQLDAHHWWSLRWTVSETTHWRKQKPFNNFFFFFLFFLSESNFQASGRNNLKIHLKFLQDLAFSFHISTSSVSQNSMNLKSWLLNPTAECQLFQGCLTHVYSLHWVKRKGKRGSFLRV